MRKNIWKTLVAFTGTLAIAGCLGNGPSSSPGGSAGGTGGDGTGGSAGGSTGGATGGGTNGDTGGAMQPQVPASLANRVVDYGQALRTAAIKLVGGLPTMDEIAGVKDADTYAAQIDKYLADPRFAVRVKSYFQDMMKMGGNLQVSVNGQNQTVSLDTAPTYAAELVVKDQSMMNLFTASTNTCPTLDGQGNFTDASCATSNGQSTVGVLTDPGAMAQFYSNMAFRRTRWVQETFVCTKFPAEYSATPTAMGSGQYVSPWPFDSIQGGTDTSVAPINFKDTSSVICANCHSTMNHVAPLFAQFDVAGKYQTSIQVHTPTPANPLSKLSDWLPAGGQTFAWRFGKPVTDLTSLGQAMAADPDVANCQVARAWNWMFSKTDIVNDLAIVPNSVISSLEQSFVSGGYKLKPVLKAILTSDDFVKF